MDRVLEALQQSLIKDGIPVTVSPMSQFGLVEITRKRVREPLVALQGEECAACSGHGLIRRSDVVAMDVLRRVQTSARAAPGQAIRVHAAPDVVQWIEEQGEVLRLALARKVRPGSVLKRIRLILERGLMSQPSSKASANQPLECLCPICKKHAVAQFRPFCSRRCADLDLGRWLKGSYAIPAVEQDDTEADNPHSELPHPD